MEKKIYTEEELLYAAHARCDCGAGMAYPKNADLRDCDGWLCSNVLTGRADPSIIHKELPFCMYRVKPEDQPSAFGHTTRPSVEKYEESALCYSATARCEKCGAGMAHPKHGHEGMWTCANVLTGRVMADGHTKYPFWVYKIAEEDPTVEDSPTTRPKHTEESPEFEQVMSDEELDGLVEELAVPTAFSKEAEMAAAVEEVTGAKVTPTPLSGECALADMDMTDNLDSTLDAIAAAMAKESPFWAGGRLEHIPVLKEPAFRMPYSDIEERVLADLISGPTAYTSPFSDEAAKKLAFVNVKPVSEGDLKTVLPEVNLMSASEIHEKMRKAFYGMDVSTGKDHSMISVCFEPTPDTDYPGLKTKYHVVKARNGAIVRNCFVLRPDKDPAARVALRAYAEACGITELRDDINTWLDGIERAQSSSWENTVSFEDCYGCEHWSGSDCTLVAPDTGCPKMTTESKEDSNGENTVGDNE